MARPRSNGARENNQRRHRRDDESSSSEEEETSPTAIDTVADGSNDNDDNQSMVSASTAPSSSSTRPTQRRRAPRSWGIVNGWGRRVHINGPDGPERIACQVPGCNLTFASSGSSTSGFMSHIQVFHNLTSDIVNNGQPIPATRGSLQDMWARQSAEVGPAFTTDQFINALVAFIV